MPLTWVQEESGGDTPYAELAERIRALGTSEAID